MEHGQVWEAYAAAEPYWSVLTEERFLRAQLTDDCRAAFFDSGREHVAGWLALLRRHVDASFSPRRILDFGAGTGRLAIPFAELGADVLGLDVSPSMVAEAARNAVALGLPRCRFRTTADLDWEAAGLFDLIHSYMVFQHIPEAEGLAIAERLLGRLAPGGIAAFHVLYNSTFVPAPAAAARAARAERAERPCAHLPPMLMATYNMNRVLTLCNAMDAQSAHLYFTNHGPYAGVFVCVQRPR